MEDLTAERARAALITGAGGLLGRCMTRRLADSGWRVVAATHAQLDITQESAVESAVESSRPDLIINCVATADVDRCEREPEWAFRVNQHGPALLARASRGVGADVLHVSTDYVFDGTKAGFYTQEDEPHPLSVYAKSKLAGEVAVRDEAERFYIVRSSWIFGAGGKNFGSRVVELARKGVHLKGVTDQTSIPTYVEDLGARIEEIIQIGAHGLYQVTGSGPTSWYDFALQAVELAGLSGYEIEPVTRADLGQDAPRPHNTAMQCIVSEKLGLAPLRHWSDALKDFVKQGSGVGGQGSAI
jgi:dTDP-4-dehydrorhamnose reductase